jgi:hypothetical protein
VPLDFATLVVEAPDPVPVPVPVPEPLAVGLVGDAVDPLLVELSFGAVGEPVGVVELPAVPVSGPPAEPPVEPATVELSAPGADSTVEPAAAPVPPVAVGATGSAPPPGPGPIPGSSADAATG